MTDNDEAVKAGVSDAWDYWLTQHDVSVPEIIHEAVKDAVTRWLDAHGEDVLKTALREAIAESGVVDQEPTP